MRQEQRPEKRKSILRVFGGFAFVVGMCVISQIFIEKGSEYFYNSILSKNKHKKDDFNDRGPKIIRKNLSEDI